MALSLDRTRQEVADSLRALNAWTYFDGEPYWFQTEILRAQEKVVVLSGGVGGGKTAGVALRVLSDCQLNSGMRAAVCRKTGPTLKKSVMTTYDACRPRAWRTQWRQADRVLRFPNGSEIWFLALEDSADDLEKLKGTEFGAIHWDEFTEAGAHGRDTFAMLMTRLRQKDTPRQAFLTANNAGSGWAKQQFVTDRGIDYARLKTERVAVSADAQVRVILSRATDNLVLLRDAPDVYAQYAHFPAAMKTRLLEGGFDVLDGQFFAHLDDGVHYREAEERTSQWPLWRGVDTGYNPDPTAAVLCTVNERGDIFVLCEYAVVGLPANLHAQRIAAQHAPYGEVWFTVIDPAAAGQNRQNPLGSDMQQFADAGMPSVPLHTRDVMAGLNDISVRLQKALTNTPGGLYISRACPRLMEQIRNCEMRETTGGEVKRKPGEDDLLDALRYAVTMCPGPAPVVETRTDEERYREALARCVEMNTPTLEGEPLYVV